MNPLYGGEGGFALYAAPVMHNLSSIHKHKLPLSRSLPSSIGPIRLS